MTRLEHLLTIVAEEAAEFAVQVSKCARFGLTKVQSGQELTNWQRALSEFADLFTVLEMVEDENDLKKTSRLNLDEHTRAKKAKVEKFLKYSAECGTLQES